MSGIRTGCGRSKGKHDALLAGLRELRTGLRYAASRRDRTCS